MKNRSLEEWRQFLKEDFRQETGQEVRNFFCPILLTDEGVPLCLGHVVNQAFGLETEKKVLQRADVDNFYGMAFEADFLDVAKISDLRTGNIQPADLLESKDAERRFNLKITQHGKQLKHASLGKHRPAHFLPVQPISEKQKPGFGFLVEDSIEVNGSHIDCELEIFRDISVESIASLIKAVHLTMFYLLGYKYACHNSGLFLSSILGWFFNQHKKKKKTHIIQEAQTYFPTFENMIRPILNYDICDLGTVVNGRFMTCYDNTGLPWATIIKVRTRNVMHGVLLPMMDSRLHRAMFFDLMEQKQPIKFAIKKSEFDFDNMQIGYDEQIQTLLWPGKS